MNATPKKKLPSQSYPKPSNLSRQREAVLCVVHADGWVEAFAERHVDLKIVVMPLATTSEGQIAAEKYLESNLPWRYRNLYWPGNRRAVGLVRTILSSDLARREWNLEFVELLKRIGKDFGDSEGKGAMQTWIV